MNDLFSKRIQASRGFSLIEVVLAIGIFLVTVLALVGLLGPTLKSVDEVEQTDEIASIVNTVNSFLQTSPDIAPTTGGSKFNAIYEAVADGYATVIVYRWYDDNDPSANNSPVIKLEVGFRDNESGAVNILAEVNQPDQTTEKPEFQNTAGQIYRVVLTASSIFTDHVDDNGDSSYPRYTTNKDLADYPEGSFPMEVRIFALDSDMQEAVQNNNVIDVLPEDLSDEEPIFSYHTAVVR